MALIRLRVVGGFRTTPETQTSFVVFTLKMNPDIDLYVKANATKRSGLWVVKGRKSGARGVDALFHTVVGIPTACWTSLVGSLTQGF